MKIHLLIGFALLSIIGCDLLDEQFFLYLVVNILAPITGLEPPQIVRNAAVNMNAVYDALAPYLPKAIGLTSRIPRRPLSERTTRNKNIAVGYALLRASSSVLPSSIPQFERIFSSVGLDINDNSMNLSSPIGIGNFAAFKVLEVRVKDGMNQLGDMNGKKHNLIPYEDYTSYMPKNTAYDFKYPGKWQPNIVYRDSGVYFVQQHIFPQYGRVKPYSIKNVDAYLLPAPVKSNPSNKKQFKKQADEIIRESANLNDHRKILVEHFDDKSASLFGPLLFLAQKYNLNQDDIIILELITNIALFDAGIIAWKEKVKHDALRPFSAIKYLYKNKTFKAWGGPGVGTVSMNGREWKSYIRTAAHSDYPSGSACFCAAEMGSLEKYFSTKNFGYSFMRQKGSSIIEPNITPSKNITLGPFKTFDDYVDICAMSRVWGGVHFKSAVEAGKRLCKPIGEGAYTYLMKFITGSNL